ncbi:Avirulence protein (Avh), partial [Phytophthora palmivora]
MGHHYVVFLATFVILANVHVSCSVSSILPPSFAEGQDNFTSSRFLRTGKVISRESEERFPQIPNSIFEKTKGFLLPLSDSSITRWLDKNKPIDKVFVRLHLDAAGKNLFEHPNFITWTKYANDLNAKTRESSFPVMSKLEQYYGSYDLAQMIKVGKMNPATASIANDIEIQQFKYWSMYGGPDHAFRALHLSFAREKFLEKPLASTWLNYMTFFNENTRRKKETFLQTLARYNDDAGISAIVAAAKKTPSTVDFGRKLRIEQAERWFTEGETPFYIFHRLSFDVVGDNVLASPEFKAFAKLLDRYNIKNPDKKTTLVSVLKYVYGREGPSKLILKALLSKNPSTENIAKQVEMELFKIWLTKYNPDQAFRFLKLHRSPDKVLDNPVLSTWVRYMNTYNTKNPSKKTTMIDTFRTQFGDETLSKLLVEAKTIPSSKKLVTDLQTSLLTKWATEKKTTASV